MNKQSKQKTSVTTVLPPYSRLKSNFLLSPTHRPVQRIAHRCPDKAAERNDLKLYNNI